MLRRPAHELGDLADHADLGRPARSASRGGAAVARHQQQSSRGDR
jgi:hypothetical protein